MGFAIGLPAAWLSSKLVASLLYGIQPDDPMSISVAMAVLAGIALLAGYIPAARARDTSDGGIHVLWGGQSWLRRPLAGA